MCGGASYTHNGEHMRVYFPNPKAKLPVITKESDTKLVLWGRRKGQSGKLPLGGWARLDSIHSGVINGIVYEIRECISEYQKQYKDIKVILTGGDSDFLSKPLKISIFANRNFLLEGLNFILNLNTEDC